MSPPIRYPTADIRSALRVSRSVKQAASLLGMSQGALRKRCLRQPDLLATFQAATRRGKVFALGRCPF